jgi:hypothetical protein
LLCFVTRKFGVFCAFFVRLQWKLFFLLAVCWDDAAHGDDNLRPETETHCASCRITCAPGLMLVTVQILQCFWDLCRVDAVRSLLWPGGNAMLTHTLCTESLR